MEASSAETPPCFPPLDPSRSIGGYSPGTLLAGRYRVVAMVGRGGMGEVYRADDLRLDQKVALKFVAPAIESHPAARERLLAEARNARSVAHPNVCRVYDVGEHDGRSFLTMEYIDGEDLASLLRQIGRLPAAKALEVARQLCHGLSAAHGRGLLHRDLKPANVMIDGRGLAKITDFGLALEKGSGLLSADAAGTVAYLAPERFAGRPATVQSDLYALGLVMYEMWTGRPPFEALTFSEWRTAHEEVSPVSPSELVNEIDPAVERAILRCLEKDPSRRPASASAVATALPGYDPLAAAVAAGETPSPELVAASGDEGILPRGRAWLGLAICLGLLGLGVPLLSSVSLVNLVPMDLSPEVLQDKAQQALRDRGLTARPADRAWWIRDDDAGRMRLASLSPARRRFEEAATLDPGPLRFCYRQSAEALLPRDPLGQVTRLDPPPLRTDDAYVELDMRGRVLAAEMGPIVAVSPAQRSPDGGPTGAGPDRPNPALPGRLAAAVFLCNLPFLAVCARINLRAGRGDRKRAWRVALVAFTATAAATNLTRHWSLDTVSLWQVLAIDQGLAFAMALQSWLSYLALEPFVRRRWPHLLVAWTRLLDGRWRDGLVGRSLLVGVAAGLALNTVPAAAVAAGRLLDLPGAVPLYFAGNLDSAASFVGLEARGVFYSTLYPLGAAALLLVARFVFRHDGLAWVVMCVPMYIVVNDGLVTLRMTLAASPWLQVGVGVAMTALLALLLRFGGLLAYAIAVFVWGGLFANLFTLDLSRWYAWRGWLSALLIVGLAIWGFRNVLGRQPAFPSDAFG
jgi:hypothetical protein